MHAVIKKRRENKEDNKDMGIEVAECARSTDLNLNQCGGCENMMQGL
jgi:hypothetical protein